MTVPIEEDPFIALQTHVMALHSFIASLAVDLALTTPDPRKVAASWEGKTLAVLEQMQLEGEAVMVAAIRALAARDAGEMVRAMKAQLETVLKSQARGTSH